MARGVTPEDLAKNNAKFIKPPEVIDLLTAADKAMGF